MWPYPWTHVGTPSHLEHMDRVAATMPSQADAGAAQEAPDIGQWEGQDVPLVRPSSCNVKGGISSSRRYLPTYLRDGKCFPAPGKVQAIEEWDPRTITTPKALKRLLRVSGMVPNLHTGVRQARPPTNRSSPRKIAIRE